MQICQCWITVTKRRLRGKGIVKRSHIIVCCRFDVILILTPLEVAEYFSFEGRESDLEGIFIGDRKVRVRLCIWIAIVKPVYT
jgi:hypothetical protein